MRLTRRQSPRWRREGRQREAILNGYTSILTRTVLKLYAATESACVLRSVVSRERGMSSALSLSDRTGEADRNQT